MFREGVRIWQPSSKVYHYIMDGSLGHVLSSLEVTQSNDKTFAQATRNQNTQVTSAMVPDIRFPNDCIHVTQISHNSK